MSAFDQEGQFVILGSESVLVRQCPVPRIKRFQKSWSQFFERINEVQAGAREKAIAGEANEGLAYIDQFIEVALDMPYELLKIVIPDLPKEPFEDEENGVTVPQLYDAFETVLEVNKVGWLKKLTPFFQNMILTIDPASERTISTQMTESTLESSPTLE